MWMNNDDGGSGDKNMTITTKIWSDCQILYGMYRLFISFLAGSIFISHHAELFFRPVFVRMSLPAKQ